MKTKTKKQRKIAYEKLLSNISYDRVNYLCYMVESNFKFEIKITGLEFIKVNLPELYNTFPEYLSDNPYNNTIGCFMDYNSIREIVEVRFTMLCLAIEQCN